MLHLMANLCRMRVSPSRPNFIIHSPYTVYYDKRKILLELIEMEIQEQEEKQLRTEICYKF